ncbi:hypothetical protein Leryth_009002 [Lithospermum erythrorhizon]|nr:hypothetical protein Leryth_009002 [Lithospermum erythrorhizon]
MFPYPEPYQSMYQRRRLGALGLEWRPSTIKFAVGTDIPLADLNVVIEPLPDLTDVIFWEPENDLIDDDTDSEYNATAEYCIAGHNGSLSESSSSDSVFSGEEMSGPQKRESLRSSKRKKRVSDVDAMTSPKRHAKKRIMNEQDASSSRSRRTKKTRTCRKTSSKKKNVAARSLRPKRIGKANANIGYILHSEGSTEEEEEEEEEDEYTSESDSSFVSEFEERELAETVDTQIEHQRGERESFDEVEDSAESHKLTEPRQVPDENKKPLIVKFSFRNTKGSSASETPKPHFDKTDVACLSLNSNEPSSKDDMIASDSLQPACSLTKADEMAQNCKLNDLGTIEEPVSYLNGKLTSLHDETLSGWGEVKSRSSKRMQSDGMSIRDTLSSDSHHWKDISSSDLETAINCGPNVTDGLGNEFFAPEDVDSHNPDYQRKIHEFGVSGNESINREGSKPLEPHRPEGKEMITNIEQSSEKPKSFRPKIRIKSRSILEDSKGNAMGIKSSATHSSEKQNSRLSVVERNYNSAEPTSIRLSSMNKNLESVAESRSHAARVNSSGRGGELGEHASKGNILSEEREAVFPHAATDASRRVRSLKLKAASRQTNANSSKLKINQNQILLDSPEKAERARVFDHFPLNREASTSNSIMRTRSLKTMGEEYAHEGTASRNGTNFISTQKKPNWLLLLEQEEGNGYIPQLNDEVMYIKQGHEEYLRNNDLLLRGPLAKYWTSTRVVELCLVEDLKYATHSGSGESCCEMTLKFIGSSSKVHGQKFLLTLPDLDDTPDFLVERGWYDASMERNWSSRDKCQVWWTNPGGRDGSWWKGRIQSVNDQSSEFLGSPWKIFSVQYKNDEEEFNHCPWELHDPAHLFEHSHIDRDRRKKMLSSFRKLLPSGPNKEDNYGILKLEQIAQKSDFINRFPVPLSLDIIEKRLEKNYYRRMEALKYDINVMLSNAQSYFDGNRTFSKKMKNLSHWFDELFLELE